MDHAEVRAELELAAVEPGGLDRTMAGDTPAAAAVAGHLAGCPACMDEFARLRRDSHAIREAIASQPPVELRERTLAFVATVGRPRDSERVETVQESAPAVAPRAVVRRIGGAALPRRWIAAAAAVLVLAASVGWGIATVQQADAMRDQARDIAALGRLTAWQLRIDARPDARRVILTPDPGSPDDAVGSLAFSPSSREIVVTVTGLEPPGAGREYGCWVSVAGQRERLGRMYFSADVAFWVGRVDVLDRVEDGAVFGVSLVDRDGAVPARDPMLSGTL